jgi:hypothetical protein
MLFARGAVKRRSRPLEESSERFRCSRCAVPIPLERVAAVDVERTRHVVTGYVVLRHACVCTPAGTRSTRSWATHAALCGLFGSQPWLPYRTPFRYRVVTEDDREVRRWRWELDEIADVDEFVLFLDDGRRRNQP